MFSGAAMMKYECKSLHWTDVAQLKVWISISIWRLSWQLAAVFFFVFFFVFPHPERERGDSLLHVNYLQVLSWSCESRAVPIANPGAGWRDQQVIKGARQQQRWEVTFEVCSVPGHILRMFLLRLPLLVKREIPRVLWSTVQLARQR